MERLHKSVDRLLPLRQFTLGFGLERFERHASQIQEGLIVFGERVIRQRLERFEELLAGLIDKLLLFGDVFQRFLGPHFG